MEANEKRPGNEEGVTDLLSDSEFISTNAIVQKFVAGEGRRLHKQLLERSKNYKNWLDDWWLDAYLLFRGPSGSLNFAGVQRFEYWPLKDQLKSTALQLHFFMKFWKLLREEKLRQQTDANGNPFSMFQFRFLFNTCRIPYSRRDELFSAFKTVHEGSCPSHLIIFYKKRLYKIQGICQTTGEIYTPDQFHRVLMEIVKNKEEGVGIAALTELNRDDWATARSHLLDISSKNGSILEDIETAVVCATIVDQDHKDETELLAYGALDSYGHRWLDKVNVLCNKSDDFVLNCDHTPLDGMVIVTLTSYLNAYLQTLKKTGVDDIWGDGSLPVDSPEEFCFEIDSNVKDWVRKGYEIARGIQNRSECRVFRFTNFGKTGLKKIGKIHPCAFIEICMQLAYMRKHGKPAPTYETATTRIFHRGRTETLRTCTPEAVEFCKSMIDGIGDRKGLFVKACKKYFEMMLECKQGRGCDRHLMGLSMVATINGEETPAIFKDKAYTLSGGGGNFILSTSFVGYGTALGATLPMRDDGYGVFYQINNDALCFSITAFRAGQGTSSESFETYLRRSLIDCYNLFENSSQL